MGVACFKQINQLIHLFQVTLEQERMYEAKIQAELWAVSAAPLPFRVHKCMLSYPFLKSTFLNSGLMQDSQNGCLQVGSILGC